MQHPIFLIGTGPMAVAYAHVLTAQNHTFTVIGRGEQSANQFAQETGTMPVTGGVNAFLDANTLPAGAHVIIATGTEVLMPTLLRVLEAGAAKVLVEKPAAISIEEILENDERLQPHYKKVFVAYNRRFYSSVLETERLIEADGGLQSLHFEFTEWAHKIEPLQKAAGVKENWFFANSTHVVDLAFFLAGKPVQWSAYAKAGKLNWHSRTNFAGAGITEKDVLFSYISNWESAGRWSVELLTPERRIYLKPLEGVSVQMKGTVAVNEHPFDDSLDKQFKPGVYKQVAAFIADDLTRLIDLGDHIAASRMVYDHILNKATTTALAV